MSSNIIPLLVFASIIFLIGCQQLTLEDCQEIELWSRKDACLHEVAATLKNAKICDDIERPIGRNSRQDCYRGVAYASDDVSVCQGLENQIQKEQCIGSYAISRGDGSVCETIRDEETKKWCMSSA